MGRKDREPIILGADPQYYAMRARALDLSRRMPANHPCQMGVGNCCEQRDIVVLEGDWRLILQAANDRAISNNTIERAHQQATDPAETYCPFFDKKARKCTIYPFRPITCISYGSGAFPKTVRRFEQAELEGALTGQPPSIPITECTRLSMCESCDVTRSARGDRLLLADMVEAHEISEYVAEDKRSNATTVQYLAEELPRLVSLTKSGKRI